MPQYGNADQHWRGFSPFVRARAGRHQTPITHRARRRRNRYALLQHFHESARTAGILHCAVRSNAGEVVLDALGALSAQTKRARYAVVHDECLDDLHYWVDTNRKAALRVLDHMEAVRAIR